MKMHYADTRLGQLHYAEQGTGDTIICLHQTPRSWDEFRELMPILSDSYRVIAMDMYGFGQSAGFAGPQRIQDYSTGVIALMDKLEIKRCHILGHHTGALVAFDSVATYVDRFLSLMISSMPFTDSEYRRLHAHGEGVDDAEISEDGKHLVENWAKRYPYYPKLRPDILNRFIHDTLNFGVNPIDGHLACARYVIEDNIAMIKVPVLILGASDDPFSFPVIEPIRNHMINAEKVDVKVINGGMIPLMELNAPVVAEAILQFLERLK